MRIIGGHDYYDSAMAFGRDTETVFIRHKKDSNKQKLGWMTAGVENARQIDKPWMRDTFYWPITVYFCDTIYRGVYHNDQVTYGVRHFVWKAADIKIEKLDKPGRYFFSRERETPFQWTLNQDSVEGYFTPEKMSKFEIDRMIDNRIAFAYRVRDAFNKGDGEFHVNEEGLKDIGFQKAVDPWTAFQELSMWVGGVLPKSGNPMVEIEDNKMKIAKAGFDDKVSFRHPIKMDRT